MHAVPIIAWKQAPFIRLLIPFIAGIVFQYYSLSPQWISVLLIIISAAIIHFLSKASLTILFKFKLLLASACFLLIFATGSWRTFDKYQHALINITSDSTQSFIATIREPLSEKSATFKTIAQITHRLTPNSIQPANATILIYFQKNTKASRLCYGDKIVLRKQLQPVKPASNPGGFNYKTWCAHQGIFYQAFLSSSDFEWLSAEKNFSFQKLLFQLRDTIVRIIAKYIPSEKEAGLAEALLIGYKEDLDKTLIQAYTNTGVVHVIAISGLHLGIIYLILAWLCKPLSNKKAMRILRPLFIISGLWAFGLLAGGSPSVLRSAVMFTCLTLGESISKRTSVYNSLAASAFLLLCYNPYWLWDTGFQLSYAAVASITMFQQPIYHNIQFPNKFQEMIWKMIATTLAAQILTTPITLFLFHQFPLLFLITNLMAIPLSSIILLGEILLCLLSFFPIMASCLGQLLQWLISLMNNIVELIDKLPFASITQINITPVQLALLYLFIAAIATWLMLKKKRMAMTATLCMLAFCCIDAINSWKLVNQKFLIVYHIPRHQAVDIVHGNRFVFRGDTSLTNNFNANHYTLQPARVLFGTTMNQTIPGVYLSEQLIIIGNKTILVADSSWKMNIAFQQPQAPLPPFDLLLVSHDPNFPPDKFLQLFPAKKVVVDGSNSPKNTLKWLDICRKAGIPCHSTAQNGAFVLNGW